MLSWRVSGIDELLNFESCLLYWQNLYDDSSVNKITHVVMMMNVTNAYSFEVRVSNALFRSSLTFVVFSEMPYYTDLYTNQIYILGVAIDLNLVIYLTPRDCNWMTSKCHCYRSNHFWRLPWTRYVKICSSSFASRFSYIFILASLRPCWNDVLRNRVQFGNVWYIIISECNLRHCFLCTFLCT